MSPPMLDTPRSEAADQTRLTMLGDLDFSIENSVPSPSKEGHDLLMQIRSMRTSDLKTPRTTRAPFGDRRNIPSKAEFTPLLKSATRNNIAKSNKIDRDLSNRLQTPAGLKASYRGGLSPALPFNSSIIIEEHTGSSDGAGDGNNSPMVPGVSSSVLSTPLAILPHGGEGVLNGGGNLATLREQEARLEQIDKENFGLKLKIHFLEEALRKNGKEFNEAALRENTELKVDKVTLQRDLKNYRKTLAQAEKDLEEYKRQLLDYAEKMKRRHASESLQEELDELRQAIIDRDSQIAALERDLASDENDNEQLQALQDEIMDLQADLREKEMELDNKDTELDELRRQPSSSFPEVDLTKKLEEQERLLEEKERLLEEKNKDYEDLQSALESTESDARRQLREKDILMKAKEDEKDKLLKAKDDERDKLLKAKDDEKDKLLKAKDDEKDKLLKAKDDELQQLEEELKATGNEQSFVRREVADDLKKKAAEVELLQEQLNEVTQQREIQIKNLTTSHNETIEELREHLQIVESNLKGEIRKKSRIIEEKDFEIHSVTQKLENIGKESSFSKRQSDEIQDLEADCREKDRMIEAKDNEIAQIRQQWDDLEQELDEELLKSQDRIQELEIEQGRHLRDLQALRDTVPEPLDGRSDELERAQERILELEAQQQFSRKHERALEEDLNALQSRLRAAELESEAKEAEVSSDRRSLETMRLSLEAREAQSASDHRSLESLRSKMETQRSEASSDRSSWDRARSTLETQKARADEQVKKLEQTVLELRKTDGSSSIRETQLRNMFDDEKERHKMEEESLRQELSSTKEELKSKTKSLESSRSELEQTEKELQGFKDEASVLQERIESLEDEIEVLQLSFDQAELAREELASSRAEVAALQEKLESISTATPRQTLYKNMSELKLRLSQTEAEKEAIKSSLDILKAQQKVIQDSLSEAQTARETALRQCRDLKKLGQDNERQMAAYEHDIESLEKKLTSAQSKQADLTHAKANAEQQVLQLQTRLQSRAAATSDTSAQERSDLHEMLKDAKLEAEELGLQIRERDSRIASASSKEDELRAQLKRIRDERAVQSARADVAVKEADSLQRSYDRVAEKLLFLQSKHQQATRCPPAGKALDTESDIKRDKRHAAELRGLIKQIEYLAARCRREEAFRKDLSYTKAYFTQQVEMYGKYTTLDLRLVKAMGIQTEVIRSDQLRTERERRERHRRSGKTGSWVDERVNGTRGGAVKASLTEKERPRLKVVALAILASVRMRIAAEKWAQVRRGHEGLLKKLQTMRKGSTNFGGQDMSSTSYLTKGSKKFLHT